MCESAAGLYKSVPGGFAANLWGTPDALCCAAGFPQFSFPAHKRAISRTSHTKLPFVLQRYLPARRTSGRANVFLFFFDRLGRAPFQVPAFFAFVRLHAGKTPASLSFARPCGETLRFPKKIRPETCFDTVKNGSAAKTFTEKGLIFTETPLIIETEVGQSG